jgi:LacI family transcriptional regulator
MATHVTLRDIAAKSRFHFTTVGAALRGDPRIPADTTKRIRRWADKLGYRANPVLSALSAYRVPSQGRHLAAVIGYLSYSDTRELSLTNPREHRLLRAARRHAEELSFKLEPVRIDAPEFTPARINSVLHARGIRALILAARMPGPGPVMELNWAEFSVVALGYSITNLRCHRACYHQSHSMLLNLAELRARGYRRIGLAISEQAIVRSNTLFLGSYLAEQCQRPKQDHLPPLIVPTLEVTAEALLPWVKKHRPDCVITASPEAVGWLRSAGFRIPADLGVTHLSRESEDSPVAGIDEQCELLGEAAVDLTASLLRANERGLPAHPRTSLVEARWMDGATVRARLR